MAKTSLLELLQRKIDLLDNIIDIVALQHRLIEAEEVQLLMENIAKRQELIDTIDELDRLIAVSPPVTEREQAAFDAAKHDITSQLQDIADQDQRNEALAMRHLNDYQQEIRSANQFMRVVEGYIDPLFTNEPHFLDKKK